MDPAKRTCVCNIFCTVADNIAEGYSTSMVVATNGPWEKWDSLCRDVDFDLLLVSYMVLVPILNAFAGQYRPGKISPSRHKVQYRMFEDAIRLIGPDLAALQTRDPNLTSQG